MDTKNHAEPDYTVHPNDIMMMFKANGTLNDRINLSESEISVYEEIKKNPFVKNEELVLLTGLSIRTVNRAIKSLRDKNLINREGSKKTGHWEIIKKE